MIADDFQSAFKDCDVIAGPVAPTVAWKLGEHGSDPLADYLADIFTLPASLAGLPGMSVPAGFGEGGMPVGLQLIGNYFRRRACSTRRTACSRPLFPSAQPALKTHSLQRLHGKAAHADLHPAKLLFWPRTAPHVCKLIHGYEVVIGFETHTQLATQEQDLQPRPHRVWRRAQHPGLRGGPGPARHPARDEPQGRRVRYQIGTGPRLPHCAREHFRAQELLLPRPAQGLPDQPVRNPGGAGRRGRRSFLGDEKKTVRLVRAHLEEDAGKSLHEDFIGQSGIDLNPRRHAAAGDRDRARHALVRRSRGLCQGAAQDRHLDRHLRRQHAGRQFRCDANVSVRKPGQPLGTRREIKNLNSFKFMQQAIDYEIRWQIEQIEDGRAIQQATVLFDPDTGETRAMRTKEDAADYRYFPDPDLPPLVIAERVGGDHPRADGRAASRHGGALCAGLRPARVRRHHAHAKQGHGGLL
jgi:hypothetical protein